jgi:hypothetical protein
VALLHAAKNPAYSTAICATLRTSSLVCTRARCTSTVRVDTASSCPTSRFVDPASRQRTTSFSRSLSDPKRAWRRRTEPQAESGFASSVWTVRKASSDARLPRPAHARDASCRRIHFSCSDEVQGMRKGSHSRTLIEKQRYAGLKGAILIPPSPPRLRKEALERGLFFVRLHRREGRNRRPVSSTAIPLNPDQARG